jgi:RNA recognition motif-containing protein
MRQSTQNSGRRSRRGPRRRTGDQPRSAAPPKPPTLLEKIKRFFGGGTSPQPKRKEASRDGGTEPRERRETSRPSFRKPEAVEVTSPRLYVGNLSFDATESDLVELFNGVGRVRNAEIVTDRRTERSKGFAFVQMETTDEAKRAVQELHDKEFMGRKLVVSGAKSTESR